MAFLAPLFLLGLAALAVPVLVHLIQRERKTPIEFPSLMFVRRIPYQSVQRRRITNWPLFLLRCAAIILGLLADRVLIRFGEENKAGGVPVVRGPAGKLHRYLLLIHVGLGHLPDFVAV